MKTLQTVYLYSDGHAVEIYSKRDKDAGLVEFVEITEKYTKAFCSFKGRLVFSRYEGPGVATLCKRATRIDVVKPCIEMGTEKSRSLGIVVGYMQLEMSEGNVSFYDMPGFLSGPYTYQPETVEVFDPSLSFWGSYRVARIKREKSVTATVETDESVPMKG